MNDEPQIGELSADELEAVAAEAIARDRISLFKQIDEITNSLVTAVEQLPYKVAAPALRQIDEIMAIVSDPLGEHFGTCILCEEPIFVRGQPDDDCESAGDEYCHRTCGDRWRKENPGERTHMDTDGDD